MDSFANKLTDLSKPSEKELIKIRDLTLNKLFPIRSALKKPNSFGGVSVRLDLDDNRFLFVPDRLSAKITSEDIDEINSNPGKLGLKYIGDTNKTYFGKPVAQIQFSTI